MSVKNNESWMQVCAQAATETDPRKLIKLVRELCLLIDAKDSLPRVTLSRLQTELLPKHTITLAG